MDIAVETRNLTKRYSSGAAAVQDLDLVVRAGEIYGFIGNNGSGKTTTLRMLVGLIRPTSGTVRVLGHPPGAPAALHRLGALIESPTFYPYLSGRDNLRVLADYAGVARRRVDVVLDLVDLTDRSQDRFGTYSLGMKQRLGVAGALLKDPALVILDEPTNGLDPYGMADMRVLIGRLRDEGRTVLFSSHQLGDVELLSDRVGILRAGRLLIEGTPREITGEGGLLIRAAPLDLAGQVLEGQFGAGSVTIERGALVLRIAPQPSQDVVAALTAAGVSVTELAPRRRSLEEAFFAVLDRPTDETAT